MESTFAHLIPEMTANVLVPLVIAVYLFLLDWRMALLSFVTLVVGLAVMSAGMKNYPVKWEGAVKAGKQMANAIVEYIGSLELSTFLSIVIFSLGLIGPIIAAFTFTDDLAVLGTNVEEISQLLNVEELNHMDTPVKLEDTGISLDHVSFSYGGTTEVLHDVNLAIRLHYPRRP